MFYKKKPEYGAKAREQYVVIDHLNGNAILQDEVGNLFSMSDSDEILETGTYCDESELIKAALI